MPCNKKDLDAEILGSAAAVVRSGRKEGGGGGSLRELQKRREMALCSLLFG
jgi:hypothetical protein